MAMDEQIKELARMIDEADKLADKIRQASRGMQVIDRNVERMKACIKMMRIGVLEPVELG
jgi:methyl-accepting chemotaxis protein